MDPAQSHVSQVPHGRLADVLPESLLEGPNAEVCLPGERRAGPRLVRAFVDQVHDPGDGCVRTRRRLDADFLEVVVGLAEQQAVEQQALHVRTGARVEEKSRPLLELAGQQSERVRP